MWYKPSSFMEEMEISGSAKTINLGNLNTDNIHFENLIGCLNSMRQEVDKYCNEGHILKETLNSIKVALSKVKLQTKDGSTSTESPKPGNVEEDGKAEKNIMHETETKHDELERDVDDRPAGSEKMGEEADNINNGHQEEAVTAEDAGSETAEGELVIDSIPRTRDACEEEMVISETVATEETENVEGEKDLTRYVPKHTEEVPATEDETPDIDMEAKKEDERKKLSDPSTNESDA